MTPGVFRDDVVIVLTVPAVIELPAASGHGSTIVTTSVYVATVAGVLFSFVCMTKL